MNDLDMDQISSKARIYEIWAALRRMYGPKENETRDPLDVLVLTILSQNTTDVNRDRAFKSLRARFSSWDEVRMADPFLVENAIRMGGLARIKAARIRQALERIKADFGECSLKGLERMAPERRLEYLLSLDGVGDKTARCVLLFGYGYGAFPVDTHIYRVSRRLGLIPEKADLPLAHKILGEMIPPHLAYETHVNMIEHGRKRCRPRNPRCGECELASLCPFPRHRASPG